MLRLRNVIKKKKLATYWILLRCNDLQPQFLLSSYYVELAWSLKLRLFFLTPPNYFLFCQFVHIGLPKLLLFAHDKKIVFCYFCHSLTFLFVKKERIFVMLLMTSYLVTRATDRHINFFSEQVSKYSEEQDSGPENHWKRRMENRVEGFFPLDKFATVFEVSPICPLVKQFWVLHELRKEFRSKASYFLPLFI